MRHPRHRTASLVRRPAAALVAAGMAASVTLASVGPSAGDTTDRRVIVAGIEGAAAEVADLVAAVGGEVLAELPIIDGVVAEVSGAMLDTLRSSGVVHSAMDDAPITSHSTDTTTDTSTTDTSTTDTSTTETAPPAPVYTGFDAATNPGSLALLNRDVIGAGAFWDAGFTGRGVDVAIIDTGVATVAGLDAGQVLLGPDLSFDSQVPELTQTDGYGHGTHLAAIMSGREARFPGTATSADTSNFLGVAPDARLVSVKIGDHGGAADVSQAIAAIDWVATNRASHGLNIRVLNLSFGYDSTQPYTSDPLAYAAEQAMKRGIVVVAAAGNGGSKTRLSSPAYNPHIIAVGATDSMMTTTTTDDVIPTWSSCDAVRNPDVVAPGRSIVSLRVPGSFVDSTYSTSKVTDYLSRGSGTSQSAAFVSGAAALILSQRPYISPESVRSLLTSTASPIRMAAPKKCQGSGVINLRKALVTPNPSPFYSTLAASTGTGTLNAARGGYHVMDTALPEGDPNRVLSGEKGIFGQPWLGSTWAAAMANGTSWSLDGTWNGAQWTGAQWTGAQWTGAQWTTNAWSGAQWTGAQWTGAQWTGAQWTGAQWTGFLSARWD